MEEGAEEGLESMQTELCPRCGKPYELSEGVWPYNCRPCHLSFRFSADGELMDVAGECDFWDLDGGPNSDKMDKKLTNYWAERKRNVRAPRNRSADYIASAGGSGHLVAM